MNPEVGVVAIGRNEGDRLRRCLASLRRWLPAVAYVDSGSTDGSVQAARDAGALVVQLDMTQPFTAARARNAGAKALLSAVPGLRYIQFIDGDCQLDPQWLDAAIAAMEPRPTVAVTAGRRREVDAEASIYNKLCDMEWNTPVGTAEAVGGDAVVRTEAFLQVEGYREDLIAGEEPELCLRLRWAGWEVLRLDHEMTRHDAAMTRFSQWWRRSVRAGHAYAEVSRRSRSGPIHLWIRQTRSNYLYAALLPIAAVLALPTAGASLLLLLAYPVLFYRVYRHRRASGDAAADSRLYAAFVVLGKFAGAWGQLLYLRRRLRNEQQRIIEYK